MPWPAGVPAARSSIWTSCPCASASSNGFATPRSGRADVDPVIVARGQFPPLDPERRIFELLFEVVIEAVAAPRFQERPQARHRGVGAGTTDQRPVRRVAGQRYEVLRRIPGSVLHE